MLSESSAITECKEQRKRTRACVCRGLRRGGSGSSTHGSCVVAEHVQIVVVGQAVVKAVADACCLGCRNKLLKHRQMVGNVVPVRRTVWQRGVCLPSQEAAAMLRSEHGRGGAQCLEGFDPCAHVQVGRVERRHLVRAHISSALSTGNNCATTRLNARTRTHAHEDHLSKLHSHLTGVAASLRVATVPIARVASRIAVVEEGCHSEMNERGDFALITVRLRRMLQTTQRWSGQHLRPR